MIVQSRTLAKYKRWDAQFYVGAPEAFAAKIGRAEELFKRAKSRLAKAKREAAKDVARIQTMIQDGEITPLE
jgi:hypothetical protein